MTYVYCVMVTHREGKAVRREVKHDLTELQVRTQFVEPYNTGRDIVVNGKTVRIGNLDRLQIAISERGLSELKERVEAEHIPA